jgi:hypothetical protein
MTTTPEEPNLIESAMAEAGRLAQIMRLVADCVSTLADKRVTLEEKMLRAYLHNLAIIGAKCAARVHELTRDGAKSDLEIFSELSVVTEETIVALSELLKISRYDLNFLEQYFEHGFYNKLLNEYKFIERLESIESKLGAAMQS